VARPRTSIVIAAAFVVVAAGVLAGLLFTPSLSNWREPRVRCSLQLDRPVRLPPRTPLTLTFVTGGIHGSYTYSVSVDNDDMAQGTTSADHFAVPVTFGASGLSTITVTLTPADSKPRNFLFSLTIP